MSAIRCETKILSVCNTELNQCKMIQTKTEFSNRKSNITLRKERMFRRRDQMCDGVLLSIDCMHYKKHEVE